MKETVVVVPVVLGKEMTKRAVDSVLAQDVPTHVLVVGNGCTDGTLPFIRARYHEDPRVHVIAYGNMISLNKLWNNALEWALTRSKMPFALVINNDVELRPDMLRLLIEDGGLFVTGVSVGKREEIASADASSRSPHPCFSCFLIRRECWQCVGKFDEAYWAYVSDADYHLRMDRVGIDAYAISVPFYHETSSTIKQASNELRDELQRRADADRETFKRKYGFAVGSHEYYAAFRVQRDNKYAKEGVL